VKRRMILGMRRKERFYKKSVSLPPIPPHPERWKFQCGCGNMVEFVRYRGWVYCLCGRPLFRKESDISSLREHFRDKKFFDSVIRILFGKGDE